MKFMFRDSHSGITIEECDDRERAVAGAEKFPAFYDLALKHGYRIRPLEFYHPDGREVDLTCAMDTDRTLNSFEALLITGGVANHEEIT
ncbi:hypothetical protein BBD42_26945 [Paenibacillus sp. BIHB 4019]|uniref:Uncharacterized protein n=1 Tax=Paenibacillus sp. BIHB 4019 TaxID=1870819 RepID=A0A1B2DPT9_9BACL|nr:hypothetical protein BBD42_26945 [Paenibacillus sp. BIHB 4019]